MKKNPPENLFIIIAGPTGTGKSSIALQVAKKIPAEIINADSRQFYREINVGTAKPLQKDFSIVPHHLYSFLSLRESFTAFDFRRIVEKLVPEIWKRKRVPILVGGSGLYIRTLIQGIFDLPEEKKILQKEARKKFLEIETEKLYEMLKKVDPECASKIHPNDRVRIIRALEVWNITGIPMSVWQKKAGAADFVKQAKVKYFVFTINRETLYRILDERTQAMLDSGWLDEVKNLIESGYADCLKEKAPLGYPELCEFLEGKMNWEETVETIKRKTRNYARRQLTWFRKEKKTEWIDITDKNHIEVSKILLKKILEEKDEN